MHEIRLTQATYEHLGEITTLLGEALGITLTQEQAVEWLINNMKFNHIPRAFRDIVATHALVTQVKGSHNLVSYYLTDELYEKAREAMRRKVKASYATPSTVVSVYINYGLGVVRRMAKEKS